MKPAQREHLEARKELRAAANRFDSPATGQRLIDATRLAREAIPRLPEGWPPILGFHDGSIVRRKSVTGFPFRVVYLTTATEIMILAYAHDKRRPGFWRGRVEGEGEA